jgi:hypothetical protein
MYSSDAPQTIVTKSLYRAGPPFSILNAIHKQYTAASKTTYGPLINTALYSVRNAFDAGKLITWTGRGLGAGNLDFFGPQMALA